MSIPARYLDRAAATGLLTSHGFNSLDIECVLDLTGPVMHGGKEVWAAHQVENIAARAWWLDRDEIRMVMPEAA